MDSATVQQLIFEALKQSPTTGNGFGFGMAVTIACIAVCLGVIGILWRSNRRDTLRNWKTENEARIEARKQFNDGIATRFDRLENQTKEAFNELAADSKADGERFAELRERILRLEFKNEGK